MRLIKRGDKCVTISPIITTTCWKIGTIWESIIKDSNPSWYCLAPDPDHRYEVGDWVLPVALIAHGIALDDDKKRLLKPVRISGVHPPARNITAESKVWLWEQLVPIVREGDSIIINDSCKLSIDEYRERYGVDEVPEDKPVEPYSTTVSIGVTAWPGLVDTFQLAEKIRRDAANESALAKALNSPGWTASSETEWPTPKDVKECCGQWGQHHVGPKDLAAFWTSREEFDRFACMDKTEPIPPQCIPGHDIPKPKWTDGAVARYPRMTEED